MPGLAVQPVILRPLHVPDIKPDSYKKVGMDTITWTWKGLSALPSIWFTLCQFRIPFEVNIFSAIR